MTNLMASDTMSFGNKLARWENLAQRIDAIGIFRIQLFEDGFLKFFLRQFFNQRADARGFIADDLR